MRRRAPTPVQRRMIAALAVAAVALLTFAVPEIAGVISPAAEDTFSEWVWDLPGAAVAAISTVFVVVGAITVWAAGHFIEGWRRRR